jgi:stage III sporulation protein SpoIIIAA
MPIYGKTQVLREISRHLLKNLSTGTTPLKVDKLDVNFFVNQPNFCHLVSL